MGKRIKVVTKCGEEFFYDHNQEVDTVEIVTGPDYSKAIKHAKAGNWDLHFFEDHLLVVHRTSGERAQFVHASNGWINHEFNKNHTHRCLQYEGDWREK